ncbi:MAG: CheR family methyltransferase [Ignavibacteriota bacterium]
MQLVALARGAQASVEPPEGIETPEDADLAHIFRLVRTATGVDFTHYKHGTLSRRIKRRMTLRGFATLEAYTRDLEQNREEANALCENCFITVTAFFREPAVFEELKRMVFPALVENRSPEDPIRIWVPGCATGEEAYSIAISLKEFLSETKLSFPIEIFATDLSETAIEKAPRRHVHGWNVGARLGAAAGALLSALGARVSDCERHPRHLRLCQTQPGAGPAYFETGSD